MLFFPYAIFMFFADRFFINPGRPITGNIIFAVVSGLLFTLLYMLFKKLIAKRNARQQNS